jgi:hypothetical protein
MWILWLVLGVAIVAIGIWVVVARRPSGIRKMGDAKSHRDHRRAPHHGAAHRRNRHH